MSGAETLGRRLVRQRRQGEVRGGDAQPRALSPAQADIELFEQLHPGTAVYNLAVVVEIDGRLDGGRLQRAVGSIVRRHPALRTRFVRSADETVREVVPADQVRVEIDEVTVPDDAARGWEQRADEVLREAWATPFDLAAAPLVRVVRAADGTRRERVLLCAHHLVCDGLSLPVLLSDLVASYDDPSTVDDEVAPEPFGSELREDDAAYWGRALSGVGGLDLVPDRTPGADRSFAAHTVDLDCDQHVTAALDALAEECGTSRFTVLLAAFTAAVHRRARSADFAVGVPYSTQPPSAGVGLRVTPLPVRVQPGLATTFRDLVRATDAQALDAWDHPSASLSDLAALVGDRGAAEHPVFATTFVHHGHEPAVPALGGLPVRLVSLPRPAVAQDLECHWWDRSGALHGRLEVSADRFSEWAAHQLAAGLAATLRAVVAAPDEPWQDLDLLDAAERRRLADLERPVPLDPGDERTLDAVLRRQARRTPDAVAVEGQGRRLTYAELHESASRLAGWLHRRQVGRGTTVAVQMDRDPDLVVALLGVVLSGAAYVPLDPAYPQERLDLIARDSDAALVLTSLPAGLDEEEPLADDAVRLTPDELAYVLYTSGSTGTPKGVMITHGSAAALLSWATDEFTRSELGRVLAATSVCFDLSVFEIFAPLAVGGTVLVVRDALSLADPEECPAGATLLNGVPSAVRELVAAGAIPPEVSVVNLAGEALDEELVRQLHGLPGVRRVLNLYGPSEDTTYSTGTEVHPGQTPPPIGGPLPGGAALVLDDDGRRVPLGGLGELHLSGTGLARAYHHRPGLTARSFVAHVDGRGGARMYRTGDIVRYDEDGALRYLGRRDHQVKLRGHRVELGEVEARLAQHPDVDEAVAAVDEQRLIGFVAAGGGVDEDALLRWLTARVPAFLVPERLVVLDRFPHTPNGKVDRKAVEVPARAVGTGQDSIPPSGPVERALAEIWADVLHAPGVGRDDDFFALGGQSLTLMRVRSAICARWGVDLPLRRLFSARTLTRMAELLESTRRSGEPPLPVRSRDERLPLSPGEERLWFVQQLDPDLASAYVSQAAVHLSGPLDVAALDAVLTDVVVHHEILRTTFHGGAEGPHRSVHPHPTTRLALVPARGADVDAVTRDVAEAAAATPFDLAAGPLLRAHLATMSPEEHVLVLTLHHIVTDGWSFSLLAAELSERYARRVAGPGDTPTDPTPATGPPATPQYADFAAWASGRTTAESSAAYWRTHLAGLTVLDQPTDRTRGAGRGAGDVVEVELSVDLVGRVTDVARRHRTTPAVVFLAAWDVLLARWSGQSGFPVATVTSGRDLAQLEGMLGFFANTVPHRADVHGGSSFADLLSAVDHEVTSALAHQDVGYDEILRSSGLRRDEQDGVYRASFAYQSVPEASLDLPGLACAVVPVPPRRSASEIGLTLWPANGAARASLRFDVALYDRGTVVGLGDSYLRILSDAVSRPERLVGELEVGDATTPHDARPSLAPGAPDGGSASLVLDSVRTWARTTPQADAVRWESGRLCFAELDTESDRIGRWLREHGVGAGEDVVAVDLPRDGRLLVAVLGLWKAGAAMLLLDCEIPEDRRRYLLEDSRAALVLDTATYAQASAHHDARPLPITLADAALSHLAYTSGSTGSPKAVMAEHRQLSAFLEWATNLFMSPAGTAPVPTPATFDLSFAPLFTPLVAGGTVHLLPVEDPPMPQLGALLARGGLSALKLTPGHLSLLSHDLPPVDLGAAVDRLVLAGDTMERHHVAAWLQRDPGVRLFNEYGPTETVVGCVYAELGGDDLDAGPVPIGRPAPGTTVAVLDPLGDPVVPGGTGELAIAGAQVSRGYLGRPGDTARAFRPDPERPGRRRYLTGDLVRSRGDGQLRFLGRRDRQVKVRGYRIELGEIEAALADHPGVGHAVVDVTGAGETATLVAYVTTAPDAGSVPSEEQLLTSLRARLPRYMVPTRVLPIERLPLSSTGKVDRGGLPKPVADVPVAPAAAPSVEEDLLRICAELLLRDRVEPEDSFFDLGGHSLLAARLVARLQDDGVAHATLRDVFDHPVLSDLARRLDQRADADPSRGISIEPTDRRAEGAGVVSAVASAGQERIHTLASLGEQEARAYQIQGGVDIDGPVDADLLDEAFRTVVARHESLRTVFERTDDGLRQRIRAVPRARLHQVTAGPDWHEEWAQLVESAAAGLDLAEGPLVSLHLLTRDPHHHRLLLTVHHAVSDGWSLATIARETSEAYAVLLGGATPTWPPLRLQYADYAAWERRVRGSAEHRQRCRAAADRVRDLRPLELRLDRPREATTSRAAGSVQAVVPSETASALRRLAHEHDVTPFMLFLASFALVLRRHSGQDEFAVGVPVAGRPTPDLEALVGFFVSTVPVPVRAGGCTSFGDLLGRVRSAVLDSFEDQDLAFEDVLDELGVARDLSRTPVFQVAFNYLTQPPAELALGEAHASRIPVEESAKFDLELYLRDGDDDSLSMRLVHRRDLFDAASVTYLLDGLRLVLEWLVTGEGVQSALADVAVVADGSSSAEDPAQETPLPDAPLVLDRIADVVAARPESPAVWHPDGELTYAELDAWADDLAAAVTGAVAGREPGGVGVLCRQGPTLVPALLGTARAGQAYVPLDPATPELRLRALLADAGCTALVADEATRELAESLAGAAGLDVPVIAVGEVPEVREQADATARPQVRRADEPAYVLFTSGSTGSPKRVVQSHGALAAQVDNYVDSIDAGPGVRLSLLSYAVFDAAVLDIWGALTSGSTLCVLDVRERGLEQTCDDLAEAGVTHLHATPTVFRMLQSTDCAWPESMRTLILGGEQVDAADLAGLDPSVRVLNLYGASECSVVALAEFTPGDVDRGPLSVGHAVAGVGWWLRDEDGAPTDVYGEVVVTGPNLAVEGTEHRSGDLAWRRPDGSLQLAGRTDSQAKVSGHRVSGAEVEARLREVDGVEVAAVVAQKSETQTELVAFVSGSAAPERIREDLHQVLPHYLVPSEIVPVPEIPLTRTGKVDLGRLPEPAAAPRADGADGTDLAPSEFTDDVEQVVAEAMTSVLGRDRIGRHDNFFAMGGQSLQAHQVAGRVSDALGVTVATRQVFERPTVSALAATCQRRPGGERAASEGRARPTAITRSPRRRNKENA